MVASDDTARYGPRLMTVLLLSVVGVALAIAWLGLHPFLVLLVAGLLLGPLLGVPLAETVAAATAGFGSAAGQVGVVIALGAIIGAGLERARALEGLAARFAAGRSPALTLAAVGVLGALVSISVFCDAGFVLLLPICRALAQRGRLPLAALVGALALGLYTSHVLIPPTPGPLAAAGLLGAPLGLVVALGAGIVPVVLCTTLLFSRAIGARTPLEHVPATVSVAKPLIGPWPTLALLGFPLVLIAAGSAVALPVASPFSGALAGGLRFLGHPVIALLLTVVLTLAWLRRSGTGAWIGKALGGVGEVILVTCAGAAFGAVLMASTLKETLADQLVGLELGHATLLVPFLVAALIKTAIGSSTVAMITAASTLRPMLAPLGLEHDLGAALATLALGAGAMTVSHVNDSYFWVVTQLSGLSLRDGLRLVTGGSAVAGLAALLTILVLGAVLLP